MIIRNMKKNMLVIIISPKSPFCQHKEAILQQRGQTALYAIKQLTEIKIT